jgi:hypothetical protein
VRGILFEQAVDDLFLDADEPFLRCLELLLVVVFVVAESVLSDEKCFERVVLIARRV